MCGEKAIGMIVELIKLGSPPRVRGEVQPTVPIKALLRITPACAGRSALKASTFSTKRDHPRVCGEKAAFAKIETANVGSPPRVRGEGAAASRAPYRRRITPACAGRSIAWILGEPIIKDHPRVCGEKSGNWLFSTR